MPAIVYFEYTDSNELLTPVFLHSINQIQVDHINIQGFIFFLNNYTTFLSSQKIAPI